MKRAAATVTPMMSSPSRSSHLLLLAPLAILARLAVWVIVAAALAVPLLWLDYAAHAERHRIFVEYVHRDSGEATVDGIPEPAQRPVHQATIGSAVLTVLREDRRVRLGLWTPFGDTRPAMAGELRERCYYDARLVAHEDLWHQRLMRWAERRRRPSPEDDGDVRRPMAVVEATFAYCDPNGLTRRERRERDRPQTARQWLDLLSPPQQPVRTD